MPNTTMNKHFNKSPALAKIYELEETDSMSFPLTPSYLYTYLIFIYSRPINLASPLLFPTSLKEYYMQHFHFFQHIPSYRGYPLARTGILTL